VILNLSPDHLERHKTLNKYVKAKFRLLNNQFKGSLAFIKKDDLLIKKELRTKKFKCKIIKVDTKKNFNLIKNINNTYFFTETNKENLSFVLEISKKLNLKKKLLLKAIQEEKSLSAVNGIVFKLDGKINRTPNRARISKIDNITWPAWDLFPLETYLSNGFGYGVNSGRSMPMLISRGCPFQCTFCSSPQMWTTKWQARSADCVLDEMQYYINKYKAQNFDFYDLTTIVRKDWILDFCNKLIKKKWNITWQMPAGTRSEALDDESLGLMVESGQRNISYAPESGSKNTLQKIKKKIKIVTMKKSIKSALSKNMNVKLNLMMGFPHETHRDIFDTFVFIKDAAVMGVHDAYIACFAPYPGSELFDELHKSGKIKNMDDEYFLNLTSYSDLLHSYSYSPHLNNTILTFYRLSGMLMFYIISFTLHPKRIFRLFSNVKNKKEESRLDMALIQLIDRFKGSKKAKKI